MKGINQQGSGSDRVDAGGQNWILVNTGVLVNIGHTLKAPAGKVMGFSVHALNGGLGEESSIMNDIRLQGWLVKQ